MFLKKILCATLTSAVCLLPILPAKAVIVTLDDSHNPNGGSNSLSNLGFTMESASAGGVNGEPVGGVYSQVSGNGFTFPEPPDPPEDPSYQLIQQSISAGGWSTSWRSGYTGEVYVNSPNSPTSTSINVDPNNPSLITALGFYLQPQNSDSYNITVTVNGVYASTQSVSGSGGAKYFGFYTVDGDYINSISISAPSEALGFAIGEFQLSSSLVAVPFEFSPTLGLLVLGAAGGVSRLKKHLEQQKLKN